MQQVVSRWLVLAAIRFYRRWLSRYTPHCPQDPICSTYALRVVRKHGAAEGLRLIVERLASCRPEQKENV